MFIDARGMLCPKPLVLALSALAKLGVEESLEIVVDNMPAKENLMRMASEKKCALKLQEEGAEFRLFITKSAESSFSEQVELEADKYCDPVALPSTGADVIVFSADQMGRGNEELGQILLKGFVFALTQQEKVPELLLFYNHGAKLSCEDSPLLEDLKTLERLGSKIMTCGTCLDYLGIKEKLAIGSVTNLFEIAQIISSKTSFQI